MIVVLVLDGNNPNLGLRDALQFRQRRLFGSGVSRHPPDDA